MNRHERRKANATCRGDFFEWARKQVPDRPVTEDDIVRIRKAAEEIHRAGGPVTSVLCGCCETFVDPREWDGLYGCCGACRHWAWGVE